MTTVLDCLKLQRIGWTPRKRERVVNPNARSSPFRIAVDGVLTKNGVLLYACPHCDNPQATRPPGWVLPPMAFDVTTVCCDKSITVKVRGRVQR